MSRVRRSRTAWPGPLSRAGVEPGHTHDLPSPLVQRVKFLTRGVIIVGLCLVAIVVLVMLLIFQRGEMRDRENQRTDERFNERLCQLLALAPADDASADVMRAELKCSQPGRAFEDLSPGQQAQVRGNSPAVVAPAPSSAPKPPPALGSSAVPDPPRPTGAPVPPRPSDAPTPSPGPLAPVTGLVCDLAAVCLD